MEEDVHTEGLITFPILVDGEPQEVVVDHTRIDRLVKVGEAEIKVIVSVLSPDPIILEINTQVSIDVVRQTWQQARRWARTVQA